MTPSRFRDRRDAGRALATALAEYADRPDVVVLGLPRGGVPVAYEVADALHAPLDIFSVRKLGVPRHEELAMGAIATGGLRVLNREVIDRLEIPMQIVDEVSARERIVLAERDRLLRGEAAPADLRGRCVIIVDDGLATGSTMRAAVAALRRQQPKRIVVAVPIAAASTCQLMRNVADECVCVVATEPFQAVGLWYEDFSQTSDEVVRSLLHRSAERGPQTPSVSPDKPLAPVARENP